MLRYMQYLDKASYSYVDTLPWQDIFSSVASLLLEEKESQHCSLDMRKT